MTNRFDARLAPGFLLAPPQLDDPNFHQSLVLLAIHESGGSMGFVLNRRSDLKLHELLNELDLVPRIEDRHVLTGGPVAGYSGFVLYEHPRHRPLVPGIQLTPTLSISPAREILEIAARGELPGRFELLLGYAGWATGQLETELRQGTWMHSAFDPEIVFDVPLVERWDEAYKRLGVMPFSFMNVRGGAQA